MQENPNHSGQKPCRADTRGWIYMCCQAQGETMALTALEYAPHTFPHLPGLWSSLTQAEGKMCTSGGSSFPSSAPCSRAGAQSPHSSPRPPAHTTSWGQRLSQRAVSPWEDRPRGDGHRAMRGKACQGLFCLCLAKEPAAGSSHAHPGPKSRCCEQHRHRDRHSGSMGHSRLHSPCFWLLHSPRK